MAIYKVLRQVDAWVNYTTEVEADSPEEATELASQNEEDYESTEDDVNQFDAREFSALGPDGWPIETTTIKTH